MNHLHRMWILCFFMWSILNSSSQHFNPLYYQNPLQPIYSGFSTWIAHGMWLNLNNQLNRIDPIDVSKEIQDAISLTPNNVFFWVDGAGIIGYDLHLKEKGRPKRVSETTALRILKSGLRYHPKNPRLHYELGKFFLLKNDNTELARHHFALASTDLSSDESLLLNNP